MSELSPCHVRSGQVMTVDGPIPSAALGVTLMHEHLQNDCSCWWNPPTDPARQYLADSPVRIEILSELRQDPFVNRHNIALDDLSLAIEELRDFTAQGGRTVVDPTCRGIGRDPKKLRAISAARARLRTTARARNRGGIAHPSAVSGLRWKKALPPVT